MSMPHSDAPPRHRIRRTSGAACAVTAAAALVLGAVVASPRPSSAAESPRATAACADGARTYAVGPGDGWFVIAQRVEVTVSALLDANDAGQRTALHPGDLVCLPAGAAPGSSCSPTNAPTHTVTSGDTWFGIAGRAQVSAADLLAANGASTATVIHPGDRVCLPAGAVTTERADPADRSDAPVQGAASGGATYEVVRGDSWYGIAGRAGVSARALLDANGAEFTRVLFPGDTLRLPAGAERPADRAAGSNTYEVVSGDSWFGIARRAEVSPRALLAANDATVARLLLPGDVLRLPEGATRPADAPAANIPVTLAALPAQGPCWYSDSWLAPRGGGRRHVGVDLFTLTNAYVYAVADGVLTGRAWDQPGRLSGNAWWLTAANGTRFFYAHLSDFAPGLQVGSRVSAGEIIGFVGDTGNANGVTHLHFEVHPGGGSPTNPYPIVRASGGCKSGDGYRQPSGWVPTD